MLDNNRSDAKAVPDRNEYEALIRQARQQFAATFPGQCDSMLPLIEAVAELGADAPLDTLRRLLHNISGHAGGIGFPKVRAGAAAIEAVFADVLPAEFDSRRALELVAALRDDFATDLVSGSTDAPTGQAADFGADNAGLPGNSSYAAFVGPAREALHESAAAIALIRLPLDRRVDASAAIIGALRRRELIGQYDHNHMVVLMPEASEDDARAWLSDVIAELAARGIDGVHAGVAASPAPGARTLEALLEESDQALAEARAFDEPAATRTAGSRAALPGRGMTVVLADDDPEVTRLIDSHLRAAGYRTVIAFDGAQALAAVETHRPDVLVLDLMLPKVSGFEVLDDIARRGKDGPRVVVLSGRGRDDDVTRAFAAGAADFMTKPFNVEELSARIGRLVQFAPNG